MKKTYIYIYTNIYILHSKNSALPVFANKPLHETHRCSNSPFQSGVSLDIQPQDVFHRLKAWRLYLVLLKKSGRLRPFSCFSWGSRWMGKIFEKPPFGCTKNLGKKQDQLPINWCRIVSILDNLKLRYYVMSPSSKSVILLSKSLGPFSGGHHQNSHHPGCQDPDPLLHNGWGSYQTWVPWRRSSPATWWPPLPRCPCDRDEPACWSTTDATTLHYQLESFKQLSQASFQALPCTRCFSHLGFAGE